MSDSDTYDTFQDLLDPYVAPSCIKKVVEVKASDEKFLSLPARERRLLFIQTRIAELEHNHEPSAVSLRKKFIEEQTMLHKRA